MWRGRSLTSVKERQISVYVYMYTTIAEKVTYSITKVLKRKTIMTKFDQKSKKFHLIKHLGNDKADDTQFQKMVTGSQKIDCSKFLTKSVLPFVDQTMFLQIFQEFQLNKRYHNTATGSEETNLLESNFKKSWFLAACKDIFAVRNL